MKRLISHLRGSAPKSRSKSNFTRPWLPNRTCIRRGLRLRGVFSQYCPNTSSFSSLHPTKATNRGQTESEKKRSTGPYIDFIPYTYSGLRTGVLPGKECFALSSRRWMHICRTHDHVCPMCKPFNRYCWDYPFRIRFESVNYFFLTHFSP